MSCVGSASGQAHTHRYGTTGWERTGYNDLPSSRRCSDATKSTYATFKGGKHFPACAGGSATTFYANDIAQALPGGQFRDSVYRKPGGAPCWRLVHWKTIARTSASDESRDMRHDCPRDVKLTAAACAAAVASGLYLSLAPVYQESSGDQPQHGASLFAEGQVWQAIAALVAPLALCAAPLLLRIGCRAGRCVVSQPWRPGS
jgi:hypothetical protein